MVLVTARYNPYFLPNAYKRKHKGRVRILVDTADLQRKMKRVQLASIWCVLSVKQTGQETRNGTEQNVCLLLYQLILRLCDISGLSFSFSLSLSHRMGVLGKGRERIRGGSVCLRVWRHRRFSSNVMCVPRDVWWINAEQLHCDVPPDLTPTVCLYKTCLTADLS